MERTKIIVKTSFKAIIVNIVLVIFKLAVGLISNSIAIVIDGVNNLSDAISSIITIAGTKLASKAPDKEHPYGHGRIEYFSSIIIAIIILIAGITAIKESVEKIISPIEPNYSIISLIVILVAVLAKLFLGKYVKSMGIRVDSQSLIASGMDALLDALVSFSTFVVAVINICWNVKLEGVIGVFIAGLIIKSGIDILKETANTIIGTRVDGELSRKIREKINTYEQVQGTYDLILHSYGPTKFIGSANIQVDDNMTAKEIHSLTKKIEIDVYENFGIILTIGIYSSNNSSEKSLEVQQTLKEIVERIPPILQLHGFYFDEEQEYISFDIIVDLNEKNPSEIKERVIKELKEKYPQYTYSVVIDGDFSDF